MIDNAITDDAAKSDEAAKFAEIRTAVNTIAKGLAHPDGESIRRSLQSIFTDLNEPNRAQNVGQREQLIKMASEGLLCAHGVGAGTMVTRWDNIINLAGCTNPDGLDEWQTQQLHRLRKDLAMTMSSEGGDVDGAKKALGDFYAELRSEAAHPAEAVGALQPLNEAADPAAMLAADTRRIQQGIEIYNKQNPDNRAPASQRS